MSGITKSGAGSAESSQRWAALDQQNERLVDASHPLLAELRRKPAGPDDELPAAS